MMAAFNFFSALFCFVVMIACFMQVGGLDRLLVFVTNKSDQIVSFHLNDEFVLLQKYPWLLASIFVNFI